MVAACENDRREHVVDMMIIDEDGMRCGGFDSRHLMVASEDGRHSGS